STDVGVFKPDRRLFRAALDNIEPGLPFRDAMFVTENESHIAAARQLGMRGVHLGAESSSEEIPKLEDLIPLVQEFVAEPSRTTPAIAPWSVVSANRGSQLAVDSHAKWARFGDDLFFFGTDDWNVDTMRAGTGLRRLQKVRADHLHLVVQRGRLFQKE